VESHTELNDSVIYFSSRSSLDWDERLAHWISDLFSPPLLAVIGILLVLQTTNTAISRWWIIYYLTLTVIVPVMYLIWKLHRKEINDFHMYVREQRIRPMLFTLACAITALLSIWIGGAPKTLLVFGAMGVIQVGFLLLVTLRWKISGHGAAIGSLAVFLWSLYGAAAAPALLAIPLVAWARVRIQRHTIAQTVAGSLAGMCITLAFVLLIL